MRLIDADAMLDKISNPYQRREVARWVDEMPTIEERKGEWILINDNNGQHSICSKCGEWKYRQNQQFCGECGADMRGEEE